MYRDEGAKILIRRSVQFLLIYLYRLLINNYFYIDGKKIKYFTNTYNAVNSERIVEIPFVLSLLHTFPQNKRILEIGNVLNHYAHFEHTVVDKYEKFSGVLNLDIVDFGTNEKFDLIISISTIEHIGFDEEPITPGKSLLAIKKIIALLKPGGMLLITVPLAYNPEIDKILRDNIIPFKEKYFLKRVNFFNRWEESSLGECINLKYGKRFPAANAVALLIYEYTVSKDTLTELELVR